MRVPPQLRWLPELLRSAGMARAFTLVTFGAVFSSHAVQWMAGQVTYVAMIAGLCVIGLGMLVARRRELSFLRLVPITLIVFVIWLGISVFWSYSPSDTVYGWVSFVGIAFLALVVGHVRDTLQTARALGDVMRWLLSISLALEVIIGILLPEPLHLLGIDGNIIDLGPIEGIFGSRNMLGFVAVLALITFVVEWRTASVRPGVAVYSVAVGGLLAALSRSPTVLVLAACVGIATAILAIVRRMQPHNRNTFQWSLGAAVVVGLAVAYLFRHQIIAAAGEDFSIRANLWRMMSIFVRFYPIQGFGWFGPWPYEQYPFITINYALDKSYSTGLNAYADLVLQVGWVGAFLFVAMVGIALIRSWLVAGERRSIVYAWTPLILVTLVINSLFESFTLFGAGLLLLVVCLVRAGQSRSWRERMESVARDDPGLPVE
ncbi:O-antigen ligase family protein [Microbacterium sp. KR10-403]|uniref:O-antigen ligase family protein n=1 Tax=Microbacterium sp. KR10-403 TaxID=3158581 RepID=UPI0032E48C99